MHKIFLMSTLLFFLLGCSPKSTVVLLESEKENNTILVATDKGEAKLNKAGTYVDLVDKESLPKEVKTMSKDEIKERFAKALASAPLKPLSFIVYFTNGATELTEESKLVLKEVITKIKERSPCTVDVIGHTDTVGLATLNQKISLKRAKTIEALIKAENLEIVALIAKGYGEEDLLVPTEDNQAEPKNRNVEIFIK